MSSRLSLRVKEFSPRKHAFKFPNHFKFSKIVPDLGLDLDSKVGDSAYGLCGGIVHCAHEMFLHKEPIPSITREPTLTDPIYYYVTHGLLDSFGPGLRDMRKMIDYHELRNGKTKLPKITKAQLFILKILLKQNKLAQLMLVYHTEGEDKAWNNHQVLAYGLDEKDGKGKILIYDPNFIKPSESNNITIDYTIQGNSVVMKQPSLKAKGKSEQVHGFFIVNPPLRDPNHSIAYLASLGASEMVKRMRFELRKGLREITQALKKYFKMSNAAIVKLLLDIKYKVQDIVVAMRKYHRMTDEAIFKALHSAKAKVQDTVKAIRRIYRTSMTRVYHWLKTISRVKIEDIAKLLRTAYTQSVQQMVNFMKRMKVSMSAIASIIRSIFKISKWREVGTILKRARYKLWDIIKFLKKIYKVGGGYIAKWLRNAFKSSANFITRVLNDIYKHSLKSIINTLLNWVNFAVWIIVKAVKSVLGVGKAQAMRVISSI